MVLSFWLHVTLLVDDSQNLKINQSLKWINDATRIWECEYIFGFMNKKNKKEKIKYIKDNNKNKEKIWKVTQYRFSMICNFFFSRCLLTSCLLLFFWVAADFVESVTKKFRYHTYRKLHSFLYWRRGYDFINNSYQLVSGHTHF